eukprot:1194005-Prorocentrum_minimum.AAC.1
MSRATTREPVRDTRVAVGYCDSLARIFCGIFPKAAMLSSLSAGGRVLLLTRKAPRAGGWQCGHAERAFMSRRTGSAVMLQAY